MLPSGPGTPAGYQGLFIDKIGMLWAFAKEHLDMRLGPNPAREVASIHTEHEPHKAWPEALCRAFEELQNPRLVRPYFLLRYSGRRRSDVVRMKTGMFDGTAIEVVQEKTGTLRLDTQPPALARASDSDWHSRRPSAAE